MSKIERPAIPIRLPTDDDITENIVTNKSDSGKDICHYELVKEARQAAHECAYDRFQWSALGTQMADALERQTAILKWVAANTPYSPDEPDAISAWRGKPW